MRASATQLEKIITKIPGKLITKPILHLIPDYQVYKYRKTHDMVYQAKFQHHKIHKYYVYLFIFYHENMLDRAESTSWYIKQNFSTIK